MCSGAVLDVGLQSVQAFLPNKNQQRQVEPGQPIIVRIEAGKTSRVILVTSFVEQVRSSFKSVISNQKKSRVVSFFCLKTFGHL